MSTIATDLPPGVRTSGLVRRGYVPTVKLDPEVIRQLQSPSLGASLRALTLDWGVIFMAAAGSWWLFRHHGVGWASMVGYFFAALAIGSRQKGLENLTHEGLHSNLAPSRKVNNWIDKWLCGVWIAPGFDPDEKVSHIGNHHGHFAEENVDGEYRGYVDLGLGRLPATTARESARILVLAFLRKTLWRIHSEYFSVPRRLVIVALTAVALQYLGLLKFVVLYWVLPYFLVYLPLRYLSEISEHMGIPLHSEFSTCRNKLGWFQEWVMHPHGDGYHLVHHLYPGIPHQHLKRVHRMLMQDPVYRDHGHHTYGLIFPAAGRRSTLQELLFRK